MEDIMNESMDRELGEIQQKLENTSGNLKNVRDDLTRLFQNIEQGGKDTLREMSRVENKINIHVETDKKEIIKNDIIDLEKKVRENEKAINKENRERAVFEKEIKTGVRFTKYMAGILGILATILSTIAAAFAYFKG